MGEEEGSAGTSGGEGGVRMEVLGHVEEREQGVGMGTCGERGSKGLAWGAAQNKRARGGPRPGRQGCNANVCEAATHTSSPYTVTADPAGPAEGDTALSAAQKAVRGRAGIKAATGPVAGAKTCIPQT